MDKKSNTNPGRHKPPYMELADTIRASLRSRKLKPGSFLGTEVDLAKDHSISRMTARRGVQVLVDEGLLERQPGRGVFARADSHKTRTVKILAGNLCWMPAVHISRAAQKTASEHGAEIILCDARGNLEDDIEAIRRLPNENVDGAIIMSLHCRAFHDALCSLVAAKFPFVVVDQALSEIGAPSVCSDNFAGGRLAAEAVIEAGHRRIAFVGDIDASTTRDRLNGAKAAAAECGLEISSVVDISAGSRLGDWEPDVIKAVGRIMRSADRPTAVVCSCDSVARSAYRALSDMGLQVPGDVSVVGYDDDPMAEWLAPPLSTIRQRFDEIGRRAMESLIWRMAHKDADTETIRIPVEYIARASIAQADGRARQAAGKAPRRMAATIGAN